MNCCKGAREFYGFSLCQHQDLCPWRWHKEIQFMSLYADTKKLYHAPWNMYSF